MSPILHVVHYAMRIMGTCAAYRLHERKKAYPRKLDF